MQPGRGRRPSLAVPGAADGTKSAPARSCSRSRPGSHAPPGPPEGARTEPARRRRGSDVSNASSRSNRSNRSNRDADAAAGGCVLERRFSFANTNLKEVYAAIGSVSKEVAEDLQGGCMEAIMLGGQTGSFRELSNKSLSFWVKCFNKWLEYECPPFLDFEQLQGCLSMKSHNGTMGIIKTFDRESNKRFVVEGLTSFFMNSVKVPACSLMMAGVWLSLIISTENKVAFAFGLFDKDDSGALSEEEFLSFAQALISGLSAVFGADPLPKSALERLATIYYKQLSGHAGRKVVELSRTKSAEQRAQIAGFIRARQAPGAAKREQHIPYETLQDFVFGKLSQEDPLTLPFRLVLERFNPNRKVTFADEFDRQGSEPFKLSHKVPVVVPQEQIASVPAQELLTRPEVVLAREIYKDFFDVRAPSNEADLILRMDGSRFAEGCRQDVQMRLIELRRGLIGEGVRLRGQDGLFKLWKLLSPKAQPQHLRMFDSWCQEYDTLAEKEQRLKAAALAEETFHQTDEKPVLPEHELRLLREEFKRHDRRNTGLIEIAELARAMDLGEASQVAALYDADEDGFIDAAEYIRLMCPSEYRLPEMAGIGRKLFGEILAHETSMAMKTFTVQTESFEKSVNEEARRISEATPSTLQPEVDEKTWEMWNAIFDELDQTSDAKVSLAELLASGFLSSEVCNYINQVLTPEDQNGFTKDSFLKGLLRAHGLRRPYALSGSS